MAKSSHIFRKILKITGISLAVALGVVVAGLCAVTLWLTPSRLSEIVNRRASEYFNADIKADDIHFTFWSSFPHLEIHTGPITVVSRNLRSISPSQRQLLPTNCDSLASASGLKGSMNIMHLIAGRITVRNLELDSLRLNVVALNDSLNNYDIMPTLPDESFKIPYFSTNLIRLNYPREVTYFSAATKTNVVAVVDSARLVRTNLNEDDYNLKFNGKLTAKVDRLQLLRNFPFELDGALELFFRPFRLKLANYNVSLGNTHGVVNMNLLLGKSSQLSNFTYKINTFDLMRLLDYLPDRDLPYLSRLSADVGVATSARLTSPYKFSSTTLPSLDVMFAVDNGTVSYTVSDRDTYSMHDIAIRGTLHFNGDSPDKSTFYLSTCRLAGEGMHLDLTGRLTDLMRGNPLATLRIIGNADLATTGSRLHALRPFTLKGKLLTDNTLQFRISDITRSGLDNIIVNGNTRIGELAFSPAPGLAMRADKLAFGYDASAERLSDAGISQAHVDVKLNSNSTQLSGRDGKLNITGLSVASCDRGTHSFRFTGKEKAPILFDFDLQAAGAVMDMPSDTLHISAGNLRGATRISRNGGSSHIDIGKLLLTHSAARLEALAASLGVDIDLTGNPRVLQRRYFPKHASPADSTVLAFAPHTPAWLTMELPQKYADFIKDARISAALKVKRGSLFAKAFPTLTKFADLDISTNLDSLKLRSLSLHTPKSGLSLSGCATNLRQFLCGPQPELLKLDLDLAIDTLSVNNFAHVYQQGQIALKGPKGVGVAVKAATVSGSDTVALLVPRNVDARIHASAKETVYTNLHLYDLHTDINVRDGIADIRNLHIGSDFGQAKLNFTYNTADIENISMRAALAIDSVNVVNFFKNFHSLLLMMPSMKNLSGYLSASVEGSMRLFPNMYVNVPSLEAIMNVKGWGLKVHQNAFIRRITRMMFIRNADDIHIANMNVRASVHDNLLELYPFNFEFDRYKLAMEGVNNFAGKLYYHIGVLHSPIPFPFGINIQGMFHQPELRFGGPTYKVAKGVEITSEVMEDNDFNLMRELKYYMKVFVDKAAEADTIPGFSL